MSFRNRLRKFLAPGNPDEWLDSSNDWKKKIITSIEHNLLLLGHIKYLVQDGKGMMELCAPNFIRIEDGNFLLRGARAPLTRENLDLQYEIGRSWTIGNVELVCPDKLFFAGGEEELRGHKQRSLIVGDEDEPTAISNWDAAINDAVENNLSGWEDRSLSFPESCNSPSIYHTQGADEITRVFDPGLEKFRPIADSIIPLRQDSCFLVEEAPQPLTYYLYTRGVDSYSRKILNPGIDERRWARFFMLAISGKNVIQYHDDEISVPVSVPFPVEIEKSLVSATGNIPRISDNRTYFSTTSESVEGILRYCFSQSIVKTNYHESSG